VKVAASRSGISTPHTSQRNGARGRSIKCQGRPVPGKRIVSGEPDVSERPRSRRHPSIDVFAADARTEVKVDGTSSV
jgi:hypothetical protein